MTSINAIGSTQILTAALRSTKGDVEDMLKESLHGWMWFDAAELTCDDLNRWRRQLVNGCLSPRVGLNVCKPCLKPCFEQDIALITEASAFELLVKFCGGSVWPRVWLVERFP